MGCRICRHTHPPDLPYEASLSFRTSVRLPASSPHGLAAHAVAFDSWLPPEGPTRVSHPLVHHHAQRTGLHSAKRSVPSLRYTPARQHSDRSGVKLINALAHVAG